MNTLVIYYSRSGTTRNVAEKIAGALGAELEEVREGVGRGGLRGYARSLLDAALRRWVPIDAPGHDPAQFDLVIVGSPVWAGNVSAPVRSFLASHARRIPRIAFFVTEGGRGERNAFREMAEVAGAEPIATLAVRESDVAEGNVASAIASFVGSLRRKPVQPSHRMSSTEGLRLA